MALDYVTKDNGDPILRINREAISIKSCGAVGDGITDDYQSIMDAHDELPTTGGAIFVPNGTYLHNTAIVFTKKVTLIGEGTGNSAATSSSVLLKGAGITEDGVSLTGFGSIVEKVCFAGEAGNTGDGLVIKIGRVTLRDVAAFDMGADGVRVGTDSGGENNNLWFIENLKSKSNGGSGLTLSEGSGGSADANGGTLLHADLQSNGSHGLEIGNAQLNTFVGVVSQSNTGDGVHFSADAAYNVLIGGDYEACTGDEIFVTAAAVENKIIGGVMNGTIVDNGTRTIIDGLSGDSRNASSTFNDVTINGDLVVTGLINGA